MKATEAFKQTIKDYLTVRANTDELFAKSFAKPGKSIDECCNFILNTVKATGCNGFDDEDSIDPNYLKGVGGTVVVNHKPQISPEEIAAIEQKARDDYYAECMRKQREQIQPKRKPVKQEVEQLSLF